MTLFDQYGNVVKSRTIETIVIYSADDDESNRYSLIKTWNQCQDAKRVLFVLLNPSIASELVTDQTVNRCLNNILLKDEFHDFGSMEVVNLFPTRSKKKLRKSQCVFDQMNFQYLCDALDVAHAVVVAFGRGSTFEPDDRVISKLKEWKLREPNRDVLCFHDENHEQCHPVGVSDNAPFHSYILD